MRPDGATSPRVLGGGMLTSNGGIPDPGRPSQADASTTAAPANWAYRNEAWSNGGRSRPYFVIPTPLRRMSQS